MRVLRMENALGLGPYEIGGFSWTKLHNEYRHPSPAVDLGRKWSENPYRKEFLFGFRSEKQLHAWFTPEWASYLAAHRMFLTEWEVPESEVLFGHRQVAFRKEAATKVS